MKKKLSILPLWLVPVVVLACISHPGYAQPNFNLWEKVKRLVEPKAYYTGPVATKIGELKEKGYIWNLDFSPDGRYLAANDPQRLDVDIWAWQGNAHIVRSFTKPHGTGLATAYNCLRYSPNGRLLALFMSRGGREDNYTTLRVWNTATDEIVHDNPEPVTGGAHSGVDFSSDGQFLIYSTDRRLIKPPADSVIVQRTDTWEKVWGLTTYPFWPETLALSPDGRTIAIGGYTAGRDVKMQTQIRLIDWEQHTVVRIIDGGLSGPGLALDVTALAWNPDGVHIAVGYMSNIGQEVLRIFDVTTGQQVASEQVVDSNVVGLAYTPDGRYLIESGVERRQIHIWDGAHRSLLQKIPVDHAGAVAVSRDGRYLALGDEDKIDLWEIKDRPPASTADK